MTDLSYADWVYEFERLVDLTDTFDSGYYVLARALLREMYPDFYKRWFSGDVEND